PIAPGGGPACRCSNDPAARQGAGAAGAAFVERFSWPAIVCQHRGVYEQAISNGR
ncbi:MAG: hypothetical protein HC893_03735, partial [Chloroflexaceae bacterium]|nr:hypothetical protein [Chloroflexaceae bacterium]